MTVKEDVPPISFKNKHLVKNMVKSIDFDVVIQSNKKYENIDVKNISELLFLPLSHRDEECDIIWSHDNEKFLKISL